MVNSSPMFCKVFDTFTPQTKSTTRPLPDEVPTVDFVVSVAVSDSLGFIGSPVNSMYEPSAMVKVFSGMTGSSYFISPELMVYRPRRMTPSEVLYCMRISPPPMTST